MSSHDRVVAFHLARLRDKNPQVRLRAIDDLVLMEATDALRALEAIYRTDPDSAVRRAAQRAGQRLFVLRLRGSERPPQT